MNTEEILKNYILDNYKSVRAFSLESKIPYSTIDNVLKRGIAKSGLETMLEICNNLNLDVEELYKNSQIKQKNIGEQNLHTTNRQDSLILKPFRKLNTTGQEKAIERVEELTYIEKYRNPNASDTETTEYPTNIVNYDTIRESAEYKYSPQLLGITAGGYPLLALQEHEPRSVKTNTKCDYALLLKGDSMEPDYPDKCILLIKKDFDFVDGDVCIAQIGVSEIVETTCKRVYIKDNTIELVPINKVYDTQTHLANEVNIIGKVVGMIN